MASQVPSQALCLFCFEIVETSVNYDKCISIRPNLMVTVYQKRAEFVDISTKKNEEANFREEVKWEQDKQKLTPVTIGAGPCKECKKALPEEVVKHYDSKLAVNKDRAEHNSKNVKPEPTESKTKEK